MKVRRKLFPNASGSPSRTNSFIHWRSESVNSGFDLGLSITIVTTLHGVCRVAVGKGSIVTLEGLGTPENPHPLQAAFIAEQAAQCGYCINGMIMQAASLLKRNPRPDREAIKQALNGNLCRCGTHMRIVRAIERAAGSVHE